MNILEMIKQLSKIVLFCGLTLTVFGCSTTDELAQLEGNQVGNPALYLIGPGDNLKIFVWGNTDLSVDVPVRPDGRITTPLVEDIMASGKTPSQLARDIEAQLNRYIKKPVVTVTVTQFVGMPAEQIRVVGQVQTPQTIPYRANLTLLDVIIKVGGLTEFAAGNRATIARNVNGKIVNYKVRLEDLTHGGDLTANVKMLPGDVVFVPESIF